MPRLAVVKGKYTGLQKARIKDINLHVHSQQDRSVSEVAQRGNLWADKRGPAVSCLPVEEYSPGSHCSNGAYRRVQGEQNLDKGMKASDLPKEPPKLSLHHRFLHTAGQAVSLCVLLRACLSCSSSLLPSSNIRTHMSLILLFRIFLVL